MFDNYPPGITPASAPLGTGPSNGATPNPVNPQINQAPVDMYAQVNANNPAPVRAPMLDQNSYNTMPNLGSEIAPASAGSFKFLLIGLVSLVVVLGGAFAVYQMILKPKFENSALVSNTETMVPLSSDVVSTDQQNQAMTDQEIVGNDTEIIYNNSTSSVTSTMIIDTQVDLTTSSSEPTVMEQPKEIDTDNDKLSDDLELLKGTNKTLADTDGDVLLDGDEVYTYGTDPLKMDTDADGLSDGEEVIKYQTKPLIADTDGDGFSDGQEVKNGYNPLGSGRLIVSNK